MRWPSCVLSEPYAVFSTASCLLGEDSLVLELRREALIRNRKLLAFFHKLRHLLVQVGAQLLLQTSQLHPERLFTCTDRRILELSSMKSQILHIMKEMGTHASGLSANPSIKSWSVMFGLIWSGRAILAVPQTGQSPFFWCSKV
jgi:hypothetical protein